MEGERSMQYVRLEKISRPVSRLLFGCAYPGMVAGEDQTALLDQAFEAGITAIDTAENYGKSEFILGEWMAARKNREQLTILTKGCHPYGHPRVTPEDLRHDFHQSLERLRTDYVDVYMLHRDDPQKDVGPIMETLNEFVRAGKTLRIGASNWTLARVREANDYAHAHGLEPFSVISPNYALARQVGDPWGGCTSLSGDEHAADRAWCAREGITVVAYASLAHGFLSGKFRSSEPERLEASLDEGGRRGYFCPENLERLRRAEHMAAQKGCTVAQIALAYVLADPLGILPAISATKQRHLQANIAALDIALTEEERAWLDLRA